MLQCAEYCWGNLEAAHPVLGARTDGDVEEYRSVHGIYVQTVRGRAPPKPFQSFRETSFPDFVEELSYELFTSDAEPFPIQSQSWPCILAGADLIGVAPTGSGKTLAFLLPALVHVMAQPPLTRGEGPIALVLEPTRELVHQTHAVAQRYCDRTSGDDVLRAGAVFGGVDPSLQLPRQGEPDHGRWPEILIGTPGRVHEMMLRRRWMPARRTSYVVLDEADQLLAPGAWSEQVRAVLARARPGRQLLLFSATWPAEAEGAALELCGGELVRVRVDPAVPRIPQSVRLFHEADEACLYEARHSALVRWLHEELRSDETVLVLCARGHTVKILAGSPEVQAAAAAGGGGDGTGGEAVLALLDAAHERQHGESPYRRFVKGEARVLVTTFALGGRGLDFADTAAAAGEAAPPLSLAVLLFDFPPTIKEYVHAIGRTARPGQRAGRAVSFMPELRFWMARELKAVLEHCGQAVPRELEDLVADDRRFLLECRAAMVRLRERGALPPPPPGGGSGGGPGPFCPDAGVWRLPPSLPGYRRKLLHFLSDELGLPHVSADRPEGRCLHVALDRRALPDSFFVQGERVWVAAGAPGEPAVREAVVVDHRVHRWRRTIRVRFAGGELEYVSVDAARPCEYDVEDTAPG